MVPDLIRTWRHVERLRLPVRWVDCWLAAPLLLLYHSPPLLNGGDITYWKAPGSI